MSVHAPAPLPRVSIVIPTFNRKRLLAEAIASVLAQGEQDFELIVVDDGSTDGTAEDLATRHADEPRLRVVRQTNGGSGPARNRGLAEARAPWTAFLDSDDLWDADYLERQLAFAEAHPDADLVIADLRLEGPWERDAATVFTRKAWRAPDSLDAMLEGAWALPSSMLVRTEVARAVGFASEFRHSEDTEFLFRFHAEGHRLEVHPAILGAWRRHGGEGGAAQKIEQASAMGSEHLLMFEKYARTTGRRRAVRRRIARLHALLMVREGRWREARPYLWTWWRLRPDSTRALRYLVTSWVRGRKRPADATPDAAGRPS